MDTRLFSTKNEIVTRKDENMRPHVEGLHIIGLDMGYSAPKCFHERGNFVFPNFCRKLKGELIGSLSKTDMIYQSADSDDRYEVGTMALRSLTDDSVVAEDSLYGRNHYLNADFRVIFETALGIALWKIETDGRDIFLQTGLPPAYLVKDEPYLRSVMEGNHRFSLTIGSEKKEFDITLNKDQLDIMSQPMGTLSSFLFDDEGKPTPQATSLMKSNILVVDAGFGTLDTFLIRNIQLEKKNTNPELGMRRILMETRDLIENELGASVTIPGMQQILKDGFVRVNDLLTLSSKTYPIEDYLRQATEKVCAEAFEFIKNDIFNIRYLIMTGGTSDAWIDNFKVRFAATPIEILSGKAGSGLPTIYANARGYYFSRLYNSGYRPRK